MTERYLLTPHYHILSSMFKEISKYVDLSFLLRFVLVFVPLYYFHIFFFGITDPKNYYNAFLDQHFNYLEWITASINNGARFITSFFGVNAIVDRKEIFVENSASVMLEYSCLGMGIMSFWIAFIVAHKISISNKLLWIVGGILLIWVINCWRIAILLISLQNRWKGVGYMDHHDMFNLASYAIIGLLLYFFYRKSKEEELTVSAVSL